MVTGSILVTDAPLCKYTENHEIACILSVFIFNFCGALDGTNSLMPAKQILYHDSILQYVAL